MSPKEEQENEEIKQKEKETLYTKIDPEIREIIDRYKDLTGKTIGSIVEDSLKMYDIYHSMPQEVHDLIRKYADTEDYKSQSEVISAGIRLLEAQESMRMKEDLDIWCRAREERGMMLIGKTTFNQLIAAAEADEQSLERPQKRNNSLDVILWYTEKPVNTLSLEDIVNAVKRMWTVSNYFDRITISKKESDTFYLTFFHQQNFRYSSYWLGYFKILFDSLNDNEDVNFHCAFEGHAFEQTLSITVKELWEDHQR